MKRAWLLLGAAALSQSGVTSAVADTVIHALLDATHDDNIFRLSDSADTRAILGTDQRDDTFTRGEVGFRSDIRPGRQRFNVAANVYRMRFDHFDFLDNTGGAANALWDWTVGNQWNGNLGYNYSRNLASFEILETGQSRRTEHRGFLYANYRFHPSWRARAGADEIRSDFSAPTSSVNDFEGHINELALDYVAPSENVVGVRVRRIVGDMPNGQIVGGAVVDNSYEQTDTGLTLDWRMGGRSRLFGGLDYTSRSHKQLPQRDFDGATGRLNFDWGHPERTILHLAAWRRLTESDNDLTATYAVADGVSVGPSWAISSKVRVEANAMRVTRKFRGDPQLVLLVLTEREDVFNTARLGVSYLPAPKFGINMSYAVEKRTSNVALADYDDRIINAGVRVEF
jgi:exopolysaccharide biosynthesis operon protein EpsL